MHNLASPGMFLKGDYRKRSLKRIESSSSEEVRKLPLSNLKQN
jgi:hypothetical protein